MTKADVITAISKKTGIQKVDVASTVEAFFQVIQKTMEEGENVYIRGFGSFVNKKRARKIGRNISTNTTVVIEPHQVPSFKPAPEFVELVKGRGQ